MGSGGRRPNSGAGIDIVGSSSANIVGGPAAGAGNLISGNGTQGILFEQGTFATTGSPSMRQASTK